MTFEKVANQGASVVPSIDTDNLEASSVSMCVALALVEAVDNCLDIIRRDVLPGGLRPCPLTLKNVYTAQVLAGEAIIRIDQAHTQTGHALDEVCAHLRAVKA